MHSCMFCLSCSIASILAAKNLGSKPNSGEGFEVQRNCIFPLNISHHILGTPYIEGNMVLKSPSVRMPISTVDKLIYSVLTMHLAPHGSPYHWVGSWLLRETHYQTHHGNRATVPLSPLGSLHHPPPDCTCSPGPGSHFSGYSAVGEGGGGGRLRLLLLITKQLVVFLLTSHWHSLPSS